MSFKYYVAVDGGGTMCRVRVEDANGAVIGTRTGGAANTGLGYAQVTQTLLQLVEEIRLSQSLPDNFYQQTAAGFGLAGLIDATEIMTFAAQSFPFGRLAVTSDATIACLGAHRGHEGGVCILGTGSVACFVQERVSFQVGGWGFQLGDQGSGAWVGLKALQLSLQAGDSIASKSGLTNRILRHFHHQAEIVRWSRTAQPSDYGAFAPWVVDAAAEGEAAACRLMSEAAEAAEALISVMWRQGVSRIALSGGFADAVEQWLTPTWRGRVSMADGTPIEGAMALARTPDLILGSEIEPAP